MPSVLQPYVGRNRSGCVEGRAPHTAEGRRDKGRGPAPCPVAAEVVGDSLELGFGVLVWPPSLPRWTLRARSGTPVARPLKRRRASLGGNSS